MKIEIQTLHCKRCGHEWVPNQSEVRICPHCKSALFDVERLSRQGLPKGKHRRPRKRAEQEPSRVVEGKDRASELNGKD
jgi:hypothetical protein